jgi:hypothetical protein
VLNATDTSAEELYELTSVIEQQAERLLDAARGAWLKLAELVDPTTGRLAGAPRGSRARSGGVCFSHAAAPAPQRNYGDPGWQGHGPEDDGSAPPLAPGPVVCCPRTLRLQESRPVGKTSRPRSP